MKPRRSKLHASLFRLLPIMALVFFFASLSRISAQDVTRIHPQDIPRGDVRIRAELPMEGDPDDSLSALKPLDRMEFLNNGEIITRHRGGFRPSLLPKGPQQSAENYEAAREQIAEEHRRNRNNFALEVLMAIDLPPDLAANMSDDEIALHIYNVLHRISTLEGLDYFSASRGRMREFYLSSFVVADDGETALPDPVFQRLEETFEFTIRQEDASFGDNLYQVVSTPQSISITNVSPIVYNFIRIAGPGALELHIRVVRSGNRLFFYAFSSLRAPGIFGIPDRLANSFYNRILSLYNWFHGQLLLTDF